MSDNTNLQKVSVNIAGRRFVITTDNSAEHVEELARMVNDKIAEVSSPTSVGGINELMLAALSLADEVVEAQDRYLGLKRKIRAQSEKLLSRMDTERFRHIA